MKLELSEYTFCSLLPGRRCGEIYQQKQILQGPSNVPLRNYEPPWIIRIALGQLCSAKVLIRHAAVKGQRSQSPRNDKVTKNDTAFERAHEYRI